MFRPLLVSILIAGAPPALAQTAPQPDGLWRGSLGAGATATSGNNESITYSLNADAVKQTWDDKLAGYLQAIYGRSRSNGQTQRTSDLLRGGGSYNLNFDERRFGFASLDLERNRLIDLELRSVIAGGMGYHLVKCKYISFDVSTGPAHNRERYTTESRDAIEWVAAEESTHKLSSVSSFRQRVAYYANLKDFGEYRFIVDVGLVFKLTDRWNATISFNDRYQSNPRPGVKSNDLLLVTGLQYAIAP